MLADPFTCLPPTETALADVARSIESLRTDNNSAQFASIKEKEQVFDIRLGVSGWLGSNAVSPRGLTAKLANRLVCVEGIVTKCEPNAPSLSLESAAQPQAHWCIPG